MSNDTKPNQPIHTIRIGAVKATIWENTSQNGTIFHTTTIVQNYKGKDEQWHESNRHFTEDLPKLELASRKAYEFIHNRTVELAAEQKAEKEPETFQEKEAQRRSGSRKKTPATETAEVSK
ncbi:MAG: hypothetical protein KDN22_33610 [Verrucomicrobiae bacterium]|nr:hypothetical protein [Verrucomicrobiae bacterium]